MWQLWGPLGMGALVDCIPYLNGCREPDQISSLYESLKQALPVLLAHVVWIVKILASNRRVPLCITNMYSPGCIVCLHRVDWCNSFYNDYKCICKCHFIHYLVIIAKMAAKGIHNVRWPMRMAAQLRISRLQFPIDCRKPAQGYPYPQSKHC